MIWYAVFYEGLWIASVLANTHMQAVDKIVKYYPGARNVWGWHSDRIA